MAYINMPFRTRYCVSAVSSRILRRICRVFYCRSIFFQYFNSFHLKNILEHFSNYVILFKRQNKVRRSAQKEQNKRLNYNSIYFEMISTRQNIQTIPTTFYLVRTKFNNCTYKQLQNLNFVRNFNLEIFPLLSFMVLSTGETRSSAVDIAC